MKKLLLAASILFLISGAAATTVSHKAVTVDLTTSEVNVDMHIEELTPSKFTYFTSYNIENFHANLDGEELECDVEKTVVESKVSCEVPRNQNLDIEMNYTASGLITERENNKKIFEYTQNFIRPTRNYTLTAILPEGAVLLDNENISNSIVPSDGEVGSNGRRITVEWSRQPEIGQSMAFRTIYEDLSPRFQYTELGLIAVLIALISIIGYLAYLRISRENVEKMYDELSDDQVEAIEELRANSGSMLQKDLVESLDYSKAKVSGIVSELVDKGIVAKEKQGRSNKLVISKKYRG